MEGFKKLPFDWRKAALLLPNGQFKVWMAHYWRSDKDDHVSMTNPQLERECDMGHCAIEEAKKELRAKGWLVVDQESYRDQMGKFVAPRLIASFPQTSNSVQDEPSLDSSTDPENKVTAPTLKTSKRTDPEKPVTGKSGPIVDTPIPVDTTGSDPSGLRVKTNKEEAVEEGSASSTVAGLALQEDADHESSEDIDQVIRKREVEYYLMPIAKSYGLNGTGRPAAEKLLAVLEGIPFAASNLAACIEYHRSIPDTFMADRISTWSGLLTMLEKGGMIQQFRTAVKKAQKRDPSCQNTWGTAQFGADVAAVLYPEKKQRKKARAKEL
jgi:hypothetical protein